MRHGGSVIDCAVLIATGVRHDGKRTVLGVSVSLSEAEVARAIRSVFEAPDRHAADRRLAEVSDEWETERTDIVGESGR